MDLQGLVGSKVLIRSTYAPEVEGRISSLFNIVEANGTEDSINQSTFRIDLPSGDVLQTAGRFLSKIDNAEYIRESGYFAGFRP